MVLLSLLLLPRISIAEDIIKVIMLGNPNDPLPSEQAENIDGFAGKVFINGKFHTGSIEVIQDRAGLYVVKKLPLEEYIEGVIVSETNKDWELEALKAKAVISRTNATLYRTNNSGAKYHLASTLPHLLYRGENADPLVSRAVKATKGEVLTYNGLLIKALFYFTNNEEGKLHARTRLGALDMAREGKDYKEILRYYYPDMIIQHNREFYSRKNSSSQTADNIQNN